MAMELSEKATAKLKEILEKDYDLSHLSDEQANSVGVSLLRLAQIAQHYQEVVYPRADSTESGRGSTDPNRASNRLSS